MYNWSTDTKRLQKDPEKYAVWKLEQMINYGLGNEKINRKDLVKYFDSLVIDPDKKAFLTYILYGKKPSDR